MKQKVACVFTALLIVIINASAVPAQNSRTKGSTPVRQVIFAVLNDGKLIEPIAYVEKGKLVTAIDGASEPALISQFHKTHFKPGTRLKLIFGGAEAGTVSVKSSDAASECSTNTALVSFVSNKATIKGNVMALATNAASVHGSGVRRLPTRQERAEIETLVRAEFRKHKIAAAALKKLDYHNLTALDIDSDGVAEMVGTFWVSPSATTRALLFFIAEKGTGGAYSFVANDFRVIDQKDVMSGEIESVDAGVYHERLLDIYDIDNDGAAEVFTYIQSFEGAGFNAYSRRDGKWANVYEGANYHCGY